MGYKKMHNTGGFADLALASSLKHNRSLEFMKKNSMRTSIGPEERRF